MLFPYIHKTMRCKYRKNDWTYATSFLATFSIRLFVPSYAAYRKYPLIWCQKYKSFSILKHCNYHKLFLPDKSPRPTFVITTILYFITTCSLEFSMASWRTLSIQKTPSTATPMEATRPAAQTATKTKITVYILLEIRYEIR